MTTTWQRFLSRVIRTDEQSTFTFRIKLESDELDGGWVASVVDLPGCMSQGETREEALENAIDAFREILLTETVGGS